jgi:zinc protease
MMAIAGGRGLLRVLLASASLLTGAAQALPDIQSWTTSEGSRVLFVEARELPMVDVRVVFDAGSARDGEHPGLAGLTNAMLDQGATGLDADAIAAGLEQQGAEIANGIDRDMAWLALRSLSDSKQLDPAFELYTRVLTQADFPVDDFQRLQQLALVALEFQQQKPDAVSDRAFYRQVYGQHPYASDESGSVESVSALTRTDLRAFYQRYYVAGNASIVLVGDISSRQARAMAAALSKALRKGDAAPKLAAVEELQQAEAVFMEFPSSQSHVLMGAPGSTRGDPDYFPLYVGNHILGGSGLISRISQEIREKRGLAYSAYSYFIPLREQGPFTLGFQTRNDQREQALEVLRETLQTFVSAGPTAAELTSAKNNIVGGFPLRVASNSKITEYLAVIGFYNLPLDYLSTFTDKVNAVTVEQIRDAFARRVHVDKMVTVVVGGADNDTDAGS